MKNKATKYVVTMLALLFSSILSMSQTSVGFSTGYCVPFSQFNTKLKASKGYGVEFRGRYFIDDDGTSVVGFNAGYYTFPVTFYDPYSNTDVNFSYDFIPLMVSGEYYFGENKLRPFFTADIGATLIKGNQITSYYLYSSAVAGNYQAHYGYALGAGASLNIMENLDVFGSVKVHDLETSSSPSINWASVNFGLTYKLDY